MATICLPCVGLGCDNPDDLAAPIDSAIYSALDYSFVVQCPMGCFCPAGTFPRVISILASTIPPVLVPINEPGGPIILRLQGCTSLITRTLSSTATQTDIKNAAQSMQAEWAGQQANCNALLIPGVSCAMTIDVCNDAMVFACWTGNVNIPAGLFCSKLATDGLTPDQINQRIAALKTTLNNLAIAQDCPGGGLICELTLVPTVFLGFSVIGLRMINVSNKTKDLSAFQLCLYGGVPSPLCFPPGVPVNLSVGPNSSTDFAGGASPLPLTCDVFFAGRRIFSIINPVPVNTGFRIDLTIGCNG